MLSFSEKKGFELIFVPMYSQPRGGYLGNVCWVCAAGLCIPHYSLFFGQL